MKKYDKDKKTEMIVCNCCGKNIAPSDDCERTAFLGVSQSWGYFSRWDGCRHSFELCEDCYERMTRTWVYPPDSEETTELV